MTDVVRPKPVLLVHGGAGDIPDDAIDSYVAGVRRARDAGWALLELGRSAVDAVEAAIAVMEDDGSFDAGRGSVLNQDGRVQLDALIMDGATLAAGGIAAVETIRNPIRVARAVMDRSPQVYFVGAGAERFAFEQGFEPIDNMELVSPRERRRFDEARRLTLTQSNPAETEAVADAGTHGTVGAVALDIRGDLAAGTSTGGMPYKPVGRVGDSSIIGCGGYADNESAAASFTGDGEAIMRLILGKWATDQVAGGLHPQAAADAAIERLASRLGGRAGVILLDREGRTGIAFNTQRMAWGARTVDSFNASIGPRTSGT